VDNFSFESALGTPGSEATNWATTSWGIYPYTPPYLTPTNGAWTAYSNTGGGTLTQILDAYQLGSGDQVRLRIDFGWPSHTTWSGASVSVSSVNGPNGTVLMGTFDAAQPPLGGWNTLTIPLTVNLRQAGGFLQVTFTNGSGVQTVIDNVRAEVVSAVSSASSMNVIGGAMNVTGGTVNLNRPLAFNNASTFSIGGTGLVNLNTGGSLSASPTIQSGGTLKFNGGGGNPANNLFVQGGTVDVNGRTLPAGTWGNWLPTADGNRILNSSASPAVIADGNTLWLWNTASMTTTIETVGDLTIHTWITGSGGHTGGITKTGPGRLTLTNPLSDYAGHTVVNAGTLRLNQLRLADSADVRIASSAVLDLNFSGTDSIRSLYINGVKQAGGTWGATGSGAQNKSALITGGGMLQVSAGARFADWASDNGISGESATDDHDGDGIKNLAEYALGTDPVVSSGSPVSMVATTVSYPKGAAAVANGDVTYVIETSTALATGSWTAVTPAVNNSALISYTLPPGAERVFARLRVTQSN
jgi:autotransporter-associated beta strand protein